MNYRHAFHAGNFGDVFKHALLVPLIEHLNRKPAPFFVLDTHAGPGRTDLTASEPNRTGEARSGILRLLEQPPTPLEPYVTLVNHLGLYPGSPAIIRSLLRPQDRLVCCELHPDDHAHLRRLFADDPQTGIHRRDGYEALTALLPPNERRGLVLIDPPFERLDEFSVLSAGLITANRRFRQGILAAWYPIKHLAPARDFHGAIEASPVRDVITAELCLREPVDPTRLNGAGLLIVNAPYRFEDTAKPILAALLDRLGAGEVGAYARLTRLCDE